MTLESESRRSPHPKPSNHKSIVKNSQYRSSVVSLLRSTLFKYNLRSRSSILFLSLSSLILPSLVFPLLPNFLERVVFSQMAVVAQVKESEIPEKKVIKIGVMAIRGNEKAMKKWGAHATYLNRVLPEYEFEIFPFDFEEIESAVEKRKVDFVITNPGMYVNLEATYGINRLVSLKNLRLREAYTQFGAVILTKADRDDINELKDFKGKTFMGVKEQAFGGWQMAWWLFKEAGIKPKRHFKELRFGGTHDKVVMAILNGEVDGGTVRTDTLEKMQREGLMNMGNVKIINEQKDPTGQFKFVHSTPLYPEWAFSALPGVSLDTSEEVAKALLDLSANSSTAIAAQIEGWTVPLNYRPVHELFIDLKIEPYEDLGTLTTLIQRISLGSAIALFLLAGAVIYFQKRSLAQQKQSKLNLNRLNVSLKENAEQQKENAEQQKQAKEKLEVAIFNLIEEVADASDGDLTVRASLDSMELSTIADLFNSIIDSLQEIAIEAQKSTSQVGFSLKQNESEIRSLAEQANQEAQETRDTLMSVRLMSQSIQVVADNTNQAEKIVDDTYQTIINSTENMDLTVDSILQLRTTVGETAKKMKRLGEASQKVSQAVSFIEEIALKTNILAINASVEAGRAGEYGEGFTIVAEQVAALAEQSATVTEQITHIVAEIQRETQVVNQAMESGTTQVVETTRLVESTKETLSLALQKSQTITQLIESISQSTVSQATTSQDVTNLMQKITQLSEKTSQSSEKVAKSIVETAQIAAKLESAVAQFKVTESV